MSLFSITEIAGHLTTILDDFHTKTSSPNETVARIDLLIKDYPAILANIETEHHLRKITAILLSHQPGMEKDVQENVKCLFFRCHHLTPKKIEGSLIDTSAKDIFLKSQEAPAIITGRQNYPIPTSILKNETLPADTYFRSMEIKLNDSRKRRICSGLMGYYSDMVSRLMNTEGLPPPTSITLDMLDSYQFDILIAYLETRNSSLINQKNAVKLLHAADFLEIPSLIEDCKRFLIEQNDLVSSIHMANFLKFHEKEVLVMELEQKITNYLIGEFSKDEISEEFLSNIENIKKEVKIPLSINLARSQIRDNQLKLLKDIPIDSIDISDCKNLTRDCLAQLKKFTQLHTLKIAMNPWVTDDIFSMIPNQVRSLSVEGCKVFSGIGLNELSSTQVRKLYLFGCSQLSDNDLSKLPLQLEYLDLRHQRNLKENGFKRLSQMANLHTLVLADIPLLQDLLDYLPVSLRNLDITLCFSEEGFLPKLSHLTHLEKLYSSNNPVKDQDIIHISKNVKTLALVNCRKITDDAVKKLGEREELRQLHIRQCPKINEEAIEELPGHIVVDWDAPSSIRQAFRR